MFEIDTGAGDNFCTEDVWKQLGKPRLYRPNIVYVGVTHGRLPVLGTFTVTVAIPETNSSRNANLTFNVTGIPRLNLLGRDGIQQLDIDLNAMLNQLDGHHKDAVNSVQLLQPDVSLQKACQQICQEFPDLFKSELGCLKDFELEVKFKPDVKPIFCKPRAVPFAIQEDLNQAYDAGIKRGVWKPTQFNAYGTPVVPIRKATLSGKTKAAFVTAVTTL